MERAAVAEAGQDCADNMAKTTPSFPRSERPRIHHRESVDAWVEPLHPLHHAGAWFATHEQAARWCLDNGRC
jgi:hypothetical protein